MFHWIFLFSLSFKAKKKKSNARLNIKRWERRSAAVRPTTRPLKPPGGAALQGSPLAPTLHLQLDQRPPVETPHLRSSTSEAGESARDGPRRVFVGVSAQLFFLVGVGDVYKGIVHPV